MTQVQPVENTTMSGKWKTYPAYKDSSVEWLGEIPAHWEVKKIKRFCQVKRGASPRPIDNPDYFNDEGEYSWVRISDVTASHKYLLTTEQRLSPLGQSKSICLEPGELFLSIAASVGKPIITQIKCCIHDGFVYFTNLLQNRDYFFYVFSGGELYKGLGKLGTQLNLNTDTIGDIQMPIPPLPEQRAIAAFLDRETAKINNLIAKKERLIELLREKRTALISHAVTKGLDSTVKMKDSGVEWIGEIPEHWEVKRLKFAATFFGGGTPSKDNLEYWSGDIPWVSPKDMKSEIILVTEDHITKQAIEESATRMIETGAVLIVVRSGILRHSIPVAINALPVALNQDMKAVVTRPFLKPDYLAAIIRGHQKALLVEWRKEGATVESIEFELLANTPCPIPPISEQEAILAYLDKETARIDALITRIGEGIEKLKEYSTALISATVTGKIDVRGEITSQED